VHSCFITAVITTAAAAAVGSAATAAGTIDSSATAATAATSVAHGYRIHHCYSVLLHCTATTATMICSGVAAALMGLYRYAAQFILTYSTAD
jgi:hypothetical protein